MADEYASFEPSTQLTFQHKDSYTSSSAPQSPNADHLFTSPTISIKNKSDSQALLYRIQTTSPQYYRVRPSHGRLAPLETVDVHVVMLADSKKSDKFLIKCAPVDPVQTGDFQELFEKVKNIAKDHRLKCVVLGTDNQEQIHAPALATSPIDTNERTSPVPSLEESGLASVTSQQQSQRHVDDESSLRHRRQAYEPQPQKKALIPDEFEQELDEGTFHDNEEECDDNGTDKSHETRHHVTQSITLYLRPLLSHPYVTMAFDIVDEWNRRLEELIPPDHFPPALVVIISIFMFWLGAVLQSAFFGSASGCGCGPSCGCHKL